jgi:hypothetical protein
MCASLLCSVLAPACAGTLTDISFTSNFGNWVNTTTYDGDTLPIAFTAPTGLNQPFLNAADSSVSLSYGSYYAIVTTGLYWKHVGAGSVALRVDGALFTQNVTFPDPASPSAVFASFALPGGDSVRIAATGLSADRLSLIADGQGLVPDGIPDAYYIFSYISAVPEASTGLMLAGGLAVLGLLRTRSRRASPLRH